MKAAGKDLSEEEGHAAPFGRSARLSSSLMARSSASISAWRSRASRASWSAACRLAGSRLAASFDVRSAILDKGRADLPKLVKVRVAHAVPSGNRARGVRSSAALDRLADESQRANPAQAVFAAAGSNLPIPVVILVPAAIAAGVPQPAGPLSGSPTRHQGQPGQGLWQRARVPG